MLFGTASDLIKAVYSKEIKAEEAVKSYLQRIHKIDGVIKAWAFLDDDYVLEQALNVDKKISSDTSCGSFFGVPIGVKDIFNTKRFPTEMGSPIWKGHKAGNDARVVEKIKWEDGIILGKTTTAEFAVHNPPVTVNPHNIERTPGTSSSGSAAAVAALMVPVALGTQTAGSLIRPASFCGVYAMKPTFGFLPRTGVLKTTDTLDQMGFFARSVEDLRLLFEQLRVGGDDHPIKEGSLLKDVERKIWKVGIVTGQIWSNVSMYAKTALLDFVNSLSDNNIIVEDVNLPDGFEYAHDIHAQIYNSDLAYYFKDEYQSRPEMMSNILKEIIEKGLSYPPKDYRIALARQSEMIFRLELLLSEYDVLLSLSSFGEAPFVEDRDLDYCPLWTMCHVPIINAPVFTGPDGLPFGLQVVSKRYHDLLLLRFVEILDGLGKIPAVKIAYQPIKIKDEVSNA
ncbi:MAG: amidase [Nitrospirae bacterium]|nr:amidase [Nitrospirota bacterium]